MKGLISAVKTCAWCKGNRMNLLYKIVGLPIIGSKLKMIITEKTGGMQESVFIRRYTREVHQVDVGLYSYGGCFLPDFNLGGSVTVGRYCSFASGIHYFGANHPMDYISTSPYFYNSSFSKHVKDVKREHLDIGNDCWIGYGVIITSKCRKIGNGAVVAAGSVVTKDIPPYAVVAGTPARIIKYRFNPEVISLIEETHWWTKTPEECLKYYDYINNPEEFCRRIRYGSDE